MTIIDWIKSLTPEDFNNIVSPITGIISLIVFLYTLRLAVSQNKMLNDQNQVIMSQQIQSQLEYEFEYIKRQLNKDLRDVEEEETFKEFTALTVLPIFSEILTDFRTKNKDYSEDRDNYHNHVKRRQEYFRSRSYFPKLMFIYKYSRKIMVINEMTKDLIISVNESSLLPERKTDYEKKNL